MNFRRSVIIAELWRPEVARLGKMPFFGFLEKRLLAGKFSKFCSERIHCLTDWRVMFKFRKIWLTGNRQNRALLKEQNFASLSSSRYKANRAQNLPEPVPDNVLKVLQTSSKSVHFRRSYIRTCEHRLSAVESESNFDWSLASSRIKTD